MFYARTFLMKRDESGLRNRGRSGDFSVMAAGDHNRLAGLIPEPENETARKVGRSIAYMREHVNQPLQVATLAAYAKVSPSHFFALFKQITGCPPMDYFIRLRMRHACWLLDSTRASVKEVAAAMGYDDPFYFSRVFKAVNQVPPSRYRKSPSNCAGVMRGGSLTVTLRGENAGRDRT